VCAGALGLICGGNLCLRGMMSVLICAEGVFGKNDVEIKYSVM
jgi:hypothetical protein